MLAGPPILIGIAVRSATPRRRGAGLPRPDCGNGLFLVYTALTVCLPLFLPLAVGVVSGDSMAGEAGSGTLRYLLTIPVGRTRLLVAKAFGACTFAAGSVLVVAVSGLVTGAILFGLHDLTLLSGDTVSLANGLLRAVGVVVYVSPRCRVWSRIGVFISTLTEVPIAAMAATVATTIIVEVLDQVPQIGSARSVLFTHHWLGFGDLLRGYVDVGQLVSWSSLQLPTLWSSARWPGHGSPARTSPADPRPGRRVPELHCCLVRRRASTDYDQAPGSDLSTAQKPAPGAFPQPVGAVPGRVELALLASAGPTLVLESRSAAPAARLMVPASPDRQRRMVWRETEVARPWDGPSLRHS